MDLMSTSCVTDVLRAAGEADAEDERPARSDSDTAGALTAVAGSPDGRVWTAFKHGRLELYTAAGRLVWRKVGACRTIFSTLAKWRRRAACARMPNSPHLPGSKSGGLHSNGMCSGSSACQRADRCLGDAAMCACQRGSAS